ncbi:hypothetical protein AB1Y20_003019 [Prymnesium parvum]|uniref:Target of rapamycin complex subunit LST8 n=1 Tax=Prymnesium parvum TaxID=97485 RepID=A0AB34JAP4_PRYPA
MADAVLASAFSPCGLYLVCGTACGWVHIWKIGADGLHLAPSLRASFRAHHATLYALCFVPRAEGHLLVSGADEEIRAWEWERLLAPPAGEPAPLVVLHNPRQPQRRGALGQLTDTAAFSFDPSARLLYSAAGDGNAYAWDLKALAPAHTLQGEGEPLYCLSVRGGHQQVLTGGEEGVVRLWDVRSCRCEHKLRPDLPPLAPSGGGETAGLGAVSCLALDDSAGWLVAGWSDGFLCSVEMQTLACVACMPTAAPPQAVCFEAASEFRFFSVGAEPGLYSWDLSGHLDSRATCSSPSVFSVAAAALPGGGQIVAAGGVDCTVDLFTDPSHRAVTISMPSGV